MNHPEFPGGTLLKLHGSLLSTSFHNEGVDNLWNGEHRIHPQEILISLGKTLRTFTHYTLVFSPTHNRAGYINTDHISEIQP